MNKITARIIIALRFKTHNTICVLCSRHLEGVIREDLRKDQITNNYIKMFGSDCLVLKDGETNIQIHFIRFNGGFCGLSPDLIIWHDSADKNAIDESKRYRNMPMGSSLWNHLCRETGLSIPYNKWFPRINFCKIT